MSTEASSAWEVTAAWRELLDGLRELDGTFLSGDRAVGREAAVVDGYRALLTTLGVGLDAYLFVDPSRPVFVPSNTPFRRDRRWGGDNTDCYYLFAGIDPARTYRISGQRGDSAYFSLTVYNEPSPGAWSDRILGVVSDRDLDVDEAGRFSFFIGPERPTGYTGPFITLEPDARVAFTRDYQLDPLTGTPVAWQIEAVEDPEPIVRRDADTAQALRSTLTWLKTMHSIVPTAIGTRSDDRHELGHTQGQVANVAGDPYRVPDFNFGWSAIDACYSFGTYVLEPDEALVLTYTPPECRFWNVIVWNQFMAGHNVNDGRISLNNASALRNSDGTATIVISRHGSAHPNSITTHDQPEGMFAFRWFLAETVPDRPEATLMNVADAPKATT